MIGAINKRKHIAFIGVNIIPMDQDVVIPNQTVLVEGQRIAAVAPEDEISLPHDTIKVENCRDKFLMPGLCDMHVHNWTESEFTLFLANGVTTIRNMWGSPRHLGWRKKISRGEILGPSIYTTGPLIDGSPPIWSSCRVIDDVREVRDEVSKEKRTGYDFLKVYNRLSAEVYDAIAAEAKKLGIRFVGHVPYSIGLRKAIESGQSSIEHLNGYIDALQRADSPTKDKHDLESRLRAIEFVDKSGVQDIVGLSGSSQVWNCTTLVVYQRALAAKRMQREFAKEELMKFVPPIWMVDWIASLDSPPQMKISEDTEMELCKKRNAFLFELTGSLHEAVAPILLGTDTPNPFVIPGFSIHEELQNLVSAGLSPYEALKAGTIDAARFLHEEKEFGTIEAGKRADLLLLDGNPLEDVTLLSTKLLGVMVRGEWLEQSQLKRMLSALLSSYHTGAFLSKSYSGTQEMPGEKHFLYQIKVGDSPLGQEEVRVVSQMLNDSEEVSKICSRVVLNAPPFVDYFETSIEPATGNSVFNRFHLRAERSEGVSELEITTDEKALNYRQSIAGIDPQPDWTKKRTGENPLLIGVPWLAGTYFQLGKKLQKLEGEKAEIFDLVAVNVELGLEVADSKLEIGGHAKEQQQSNFPNKYGSAGSEYQEYALSDKRTFATFNGRIRVNERGVPIVLRGPSALYGLTHQLIDSW